MNKKYLEENRMFIENMLMQYYFVFWHKISCQHTCIHLDTLKFGGSLLF